MTSSPLRALHLGAEHSTVKLHLGEVLALDGNQMPTLTASPTDPAAVIGSLRQLLSLKEVSHRLSLVTRKYILKETRHGRPKENGL